MHVDRLAHEDRAEHVALQLLDRDHDDEHDDGRPEALEGERHEDDDRAREDPVSLGEEQEGRDDGQERGQQERPCGVAEVERASGHIPTLAGEPLLRAVESLFDGASPPRRGDG